MIHYSCDMCGRSIREERYAVKIEVAAAFDPDEITESDLDVDHLQQIAATLDELESTADFNLPDTGPKLMQFDLCAHCVGRYVKSPLSAKRSGIRPNYSQN
ncbi:hypothetical protein [Planctomicrobium sp. SH527]|uniref:hypothetical protein n=1 Tax=Planctomicrobium sp. SH527 TaxID=3448123 RepID=UPI003F5C146F